MSPTDPRTNSIPLDFLDVDKFCDILASVLPPTVFDLISSRQNHIHNPYQQYVERYLSHLITDDVPSPSTLSLSSASLRRRPIFSNLVKVLDSSL
jgi:hypothetical protein